LWQPRGAPTLRTMGIAEDIAAPEGWHAALAALAWQADLGAVEAIGDVPVSRYDLSDVAKPVPMAVPAAVVAVVPVAKGAAPVADRTYTANPAGAVPENLEAAIMAARHAAQPAASLADLQKAMQAYAHCDLRRGARNLVFGDGNPAARVMIITDAPDVAEDREGRPCVGQTGALLDRMFTAIGLARDAPDAAMAIYITPALPWRTPQDSVPTDADLAMLRPFLDRHIELVNPDVVVLMGDAPLRALLGQTGILRLRGQWAELVGRPVLPMIHPAYLLRNPAAKREAWADLLALQARLREAQV